MPGTDAPSASTGGSTTSLSHLPWQMIPAFKAGETDINEYTKRLEFFADLWPVEHLSLLAPRAAMLCEGGAFKRLMRIDAKKLKVNSLDGIKLLVTTLGGVWGKAKHEKKFERFERAIYSTTQRPDETHESYLARHDFQFEELAALNVTLDEMRAYCLLRNSGLLMDEKKKVIMDSAGRLEYDSVVSAIKLLGSKFFTELQTAGKSTNRTKTYETANVIEEEETGTQQDDEAFFQEHWDEESALIFDETDQDVLVVQQFEDSLVEVLQSDPETAACFHSYMEARRRIAEKNKNRGFWPTKGSSGKGKSKAKFSFKGFGKGRKPLSQRILESECRRCGQKGHWKAECPRRFDQEAKPSGTTASAFAGTVLTMPDSTGDEDMILISDFSASASIAPRSVYQTVFCVDTTCSAKWDLGDRGSVWGGNRNLFNAHAHRLISSLKTMLPALSTAQPSPLTCESESTRVVQPSGQRGLHEGHDVMFVHHGPCGIVDLGASQTVIGLSQVTELLHELPTNVKSRVQKVSCHTTFRFGNSSTVTCSFAYLVPLAHWYVKVCVVPSDTPFLLSNNVFRKLGAVIDTERAMIHFSKLKFSMPLTLTERNLFLLDFCKLITLASKSEPGGSQTPSSLTPQDILTLGHETGSHEPLEGLPCGSSAKVIETNTIPKTNTNDFETPKLEQLQNVSLDHTQEPDADQLAGSNSQDPTVCSISCDHVEDSGRDHRAALPESHPVLHGPDRQGRVSESDFGRARTPSDHFRKGEEGTAVPGSRTEGSTLCRMVREHIQGLRQDLSPEIHPLCQALHGRLGAQERDTAGSSRDNPPSGGKHCNPWSCIESQGDASSEHLSRNHESQSTILECLDASQRCMGAHSRGDSPTEPEGHGDRRSPDTDRGAAATALDASGVDSKRAVDPTSEDLQLTDSMQRSQACDALNSLENPKGDDLDWENHCDIHLSQELVPNQILLEMHKFWKHRFGIHSFEQQHRHLSRQGIDVLEVYCSSESQLTHQAIQGGLIAARFGLRQGDLATYAGRCALYEIIWLKRPTHIWVSPRCGPWCSWSRLNLMKSQALAHRILTDRRQENVHLLLCSALCCLQLWRGDTYHFHLEQPQGSELIYQHEMKAILDSTDRVLCDMCIAGELRHPNSQALLRKRTQVLTTSSIMTRRLEQLQCPGTHSHDLIAGSCWTRKEGRVSLSKYTEQYTQTFAKQLIRVIKCSLATREPQCLSSPHGQYTLHTDTADEQPAEPPASKRRRLHTKSPATELYEPPESVDPTVQLEPLLGRFEELAPRVGKRILLEGPLFSQVQTLFPHMHIQAIDLCKGVDRRRTMSFPEGLGTHRLMFGKSRKEGMFFSDSTWEPWRDISHRQAIRKTDHPAILGITIFAHPREPSRSSVEPSGQPSAHPGILSETPPGDERDRATDTPVQSQTDGPKDDQSRERAVQHGPMFRALPGALQTQLKRMHKNLGHPNAEQFARALHDHGWAPAVQQAVRDMACDTCHEMTLPKVARPAHLHVAREFNELVQFDNCEWTDPNGKRHTFFHFIDIESNFHTAVPYVSKTTEALIACFQGAWLLWAGPPQGLMFDSATEANSDQFAQHLLELGIKSHVIPTDAHWQLGRVERHGAILQNMLTKMFKDQPFESHQEFGERLTAACNAKNALSRIKGYTPELLVLGKSRRIPGSLSDDSEISSNIAALQSETEQSQFHHQLALRESARAAFVRADNCHELRRSLRSRSRPGRNLYSVGDWATFWKNQKWQGPAKVLMLDGQNLIWLSHLTRLIRCAPEHLRQLSTRELGDLKALPADGEPPKPGTGVFQYHQLTESPPAGVGSFSNGSSSQTAIHRSSSSHRPEALDPTVEASPEDENNLGSNAPLVFIPKHSQTPSLRTCRMSHRHQ